MVPRGPAARQPILTFGRWNYLQGGITKIMNNLQDGLDMVTVSTCHPRTRWACEGPSADMVSE